MFLKSCKGRKSCLDPIPKLFMIFKNSQQRFFSSSSTIIDDNSSQFHFFCKIFIIMKFSSFLQSLKIVTANESKPSMEISPSVVFSKNPKSPKTDHPEKVDFGPFSTSLYTPIHRLFRDGAKMVIFEGSRPQNRKKALFCKKT